MQRCEAIRQQHEQLRRGDGADQSSSNQVGHRFSDTIFPLLQQTVTDSRPHAVCRFRTGSRTRTGTGEEAGTGGRRCRASPRPRATAAAASLNPPPADATDRTLASGRRSLSFFFLDFCLLVSIKCLSLARNEKKNCKSECQSRINRKFVSSLMWFGMVKLKLKLRIQINRVFYQLQLSRA